jgi:hypothetical protein
MRRLSDAYCEEAYPEGPGEIPGVAGVFRLADRPDAGQLPLAPRPHIQVVTRTVVPASDERSATRSHNWFTR